MTSGGIDVKQRTREIIRITGLLLPVVLTLYGAFIRTDILGGFSPDIIFPTIMFPWIALGIIMLFFPAKEKADVTVRLVAYHICAGAYIIILSGFFMPVVLAGWIVLLLASYIYLSNKGLVLNLSFLSLIVIVDIIAHASSSRVLLTDSMSLISIFMVGAVIVILNRIQQADSDDLVRSKAEEALQRDRLNTLINNLADAVISINNKGHIEVYNAASLNLLNTNVGLNGQIIDDVIKVRDQQNHTVKLFDMAKASRGVKIRDDLSLMTDGESIRLEVTASPVRSSYSHAKAAGSADGYVLILRDITKAKSLEEERDEFISVVSHELRTPITIVEGTLSNAQLLAARGDVSPEMIKQSLAEAHDQTVFLSKMVNDLSTLSRAERGVADATEEIDMKAFINGLYSEYAPQAEKKHLHLNLDITGQLGMITASPLYVRELLQNLLTNAIKYTKEGSVTLHATRSNKHITISVVDTGIGISRSDQAKIFHKFYRSEDYRTRETNGTGLGLYVAAKLAKKLKTTIEVTSRLNHGSEFSFSLPVDTDQVN